MNIMPNPDGACVRDVLAGNPDRFRSLVERHWRAVFATAIAHTRNATEAEDVVQDAFIDAYRSLNTLRAPDRFGPWVLTIARNRARSYLRRTSEATTESDVASAESPESEAHRKEMLAILSAALDNLATGERETILLHYFAGRSAREIAKATDVSRAAVLKRLERGRAHLGAHILEQLGSRESVRDMMSPTVNRITRDALAAGTAWQGARVSSASGVAAAVSAVLPSAGTIAAGLAGVAFTIAFAWMYLSESNVEPAGAAIEKTAVESGEPSVARTAATEIPAAIATIFPSDEEQAPQPTAGSNERETATVALAQASSPTTAAPHSSLDGEWDVRYQTGVDGFGPLARLEFTESSEGVRIRVAEPREIHWDLVLSRDASAVTLTMSDRHSSARLEGEVNETFDEMALSGTWEYPTGGEAPVQVRATRVTDKTRERDREIAEFREELLEIFAQLQAYANDHEGVYPESLEVLHPDYIANRALFRDTETRTVNYARAAWIALDDLIDEALNSTDRDRMLEIEHYLVDLWGDRFGENIPPLTGVAHDLKAVFIVDINGWIFEGAYGQARETVEAADAGNLWAECANRLKQIGLCSKMFEYEHAASYFPAGLRTLYPRFMSDTRIASCPGAEPNADSYDIVFPARPAAWMEDRAAEVLGLGATPTDDRELVVLQSRIPFVIETHECAGSGKRHVLYLDGHVALVDDVIWQTEIAPFL